MMNSVFESTIRVKDTKLVLGLVEEDFSLLSMRLLSLISTNLTPVYRLQNYKI
jgi:hypothetical protein